MRYMLLVYLDENKLDDSERELCYGESAELCHQLKATGHFLDAAPLHPTSTAASVRMREGKQLVTDGPFAETREQLGGFFMVNARDQREALALAARIPAARFGTIEVRPVIEIAGLPEPESDRLAFSKE